MTSHHTPGLPTRTATVWRNHLLIGACVLALCAPHAAFAQSAAALRSSAAAARGQATVAAQTAALARPGAPVGRGAQSAAALRASTNAARVSRAVAARSTANEMARQAALSMMSTVQNGLAVGGLNPVANGVRIENIPLDTPGLNLWHGANAPTQTTANGQTTVTVKQTEQRAVLSWETFNVGRETTLVFDQKQDGVAQQSWIALNRVVGQLDPLTGRRDPSRGADPSRIAGQIQADGTVIIINQNGVMFTPTGRVTAQSAIATSLEISSPPTASSGRSVNDQLRAGSAAFIRDGLLRNDTEIQRVLPGQTFAGGPAIARLGAQFTSTLDGPLQNSGTIEDRVEGAVTVEAGADLATGDGGYLILAAPTVSNAGVLRATNGSVSLVAGKEVVLRAATGAGNAGDPNIRGIVAYSPIISQHILRETVAQPANVVSGAFTATNTGLIQSTRGYLSIIAGVNNFQALQRNPAGVVVDANGNPVTGNAVPATMSGTSAGEVLNSGILLASTSVARNGFIDLVGGRITLSAFPNGSTVANQDLGIVAVLPDDNGGTVPNSPDVVADFRVSRVSLTATLAFNDSADERVVSTGGDFELLADTLVYAPGGDVVVGGGDPRQPLGTAAFADRIFIDTGAAIDVSGVQDLVVPASRNSVRIRPVTRNELRDTPDYREGFLRGATVLVDPRLSGVREDGVAWIGSPLVEAGSFAQQVGVTSGELLTRGGTISLGTAVNASLAAPSTSQLVIKPGATLDVSGGFVRYEAGLVQTSRLVTASGQIVDIGVADPNEQYVSLLQPSVESQDRFGVQQRFTNPLATGSRFVEEFIEGRDAGAILIQAQSAALDGNFFGAVTTGSRQIADSSPRSASSSIRNDVRRLQVVGSELPAGGLFSFESFGNAAGGGISGTVVAPGGGDILISRDYVRLAASATIVPAARLGTVQLDSDLFGDGGFAQTTLVTSGAIAIAQGATVTLQNGGAFTALAGRTISIAEGAGIRVQSGLIDLETFASRQGSSFSNGDDTLTDTSFDIRVDGTLSVKGRWVNDFGVTDLLARGGSAYLDGGSISLMVASRIQEPSADPTTVIDRSGSILINSSAILDLSGGGYIDPEGDFTLNSRGGDLTLRNSTVYFGLGGGRDASGQLIDVGNDFRLRALLRPAVTPLNNLNGNPVNPSEVAAQVNIDAEAQIRGHGFAGGGTFALTTPALSLLSREDYDDLYEDGGFTGPGTVLPLDFIASFGFASYDVTVYKTRIFENPLETRDGRTAGGFNALLDTEIVRLGEGQTLRLEQARFSPFLTNDQVLRLRGGAQGAEQAGVQTGADLYSDAVAAFLRPTLAANSFDQLPVSLTLGGLTELVVESGATVTGAANARLTAAKIKVADGGLIRLPGGSVTLDERLPTAFANANAIGIRNLSDILTPTVNADGETIYIEEDPSTLDGSLRNVDVVNREIPIYFIGDVDQADAIDIESGGILDLSGVSLRNPRAEANPFNNLLLRTGRVVSGGSLVAEPFTLQVTFRDIFSFSDINPILLITGNVNSNTTNNGGADRLGRSAILSEGAVLDLSGVSDTYDQLDAAGRYIASRQWSAAGNLTLNAGSRITGADIRARGGDTAAQDGTLLIRQANPLAASVTTLVNLDLDIPTAPVGAISAETINAAGFETLEVQGALSTIGDVDLSLGRSFILSNLPTNTNVFTAPSISVSGNLAIDAPYVRLQSSDQRESPGALVVDQVTNTFTVNADAIDLVGSISLGNTLDRVSLAATGDVRLIGVAERAVLTGSATQRADRDATTLEGAFIVPGDLTITAVQVYPATGTTFLIGSTADTGSVTFARASDTAPLAPYSAGGKLSVFAAAITQNGILRAPLGSLILGSEAPRRVQDGINADAGLFPATQSLSIGAESITSVSANGLSIPYGTTTDRTEYFFAPTSGGDLRTLPESQLDLRANLALAGGSISIDAGAEVDLRGGGDAYGYEFVSGVGGSRDVLNSVNTDVFSSNDFDPDTGVGFQFPDGRQVYAIVPSLRDVPVALQDPILSNPNPGVDGTSYDPLYAGSQVGRRVFLEAAPGLAAGWYTLLPAQYALLPGGFRIVEQSSNGIAGQSRQLQGGATLVAGRYGLGNSEESQVRVFNVQSQPVFRQSSNLSLTSFTSAVESANARAGRAIPQLPRDAARLTINPLNGLQIDAAFLAQAAQGGRGSQVDITGTNIVISDTGAGGGNAVVALSSRALTNLNAGSLFIGGTRSQNVDGSTTLAISADQITLQNSASAPLSAGEILLGVDGAGSSITLADGAVIRTDLDVTLTDTSPFIIDGASAGVTGEGALVRVANGPERAVQRLNVETIANPAMRPGLNAGLATLDGTSVALLSTGTLVLDPLLDIATDNLSVGAGAIELIADAGQTPTVGRLSLTPELLQLLANTQSLTLSSLNPIGIFAGSYSFGTLTLDAPSLALEGTGDVALNVTDLSLQNSTLVAAAPVAPASGANLRVTSRDLSLNDGPISLAGFEVVTLAATGGIFYQGEGALSAETAALSIATPLIVDRAVDIPIGEAASTIDYAVTTAGALSITGSAGVSATLPEGTPGARLALNAATISIENTDIRATAGSLQVQANAGDVLVSGDATLAAPSFTRVFGDAQDPFRVSAPGGLIAVEAQDAISLAAGVTLNIGGGEQGLGRAGMLSLVAGGVIDGFAGATILADAPERGAALRLRQANSFDLGAFASSIGSAFTGEIDIESGAGDLALASGQGLRARDIRLVANGGAVSVAGTLDASGLDRETIDSVLAADADNVSGGSITLYGNNGLTLAATARLDAHTDGYKITDERRARGGDVTLGVGADDASLRIDSGATIDVTARRSGNRLVPQLRNGVTFYTFVEADQGGTVNLRAPIIEQAGSDSINVTAAGQILGARAVRLEAFKRYDLQAIADGGAFAGVTRSGNTITLDVRTDLDPTGLDGTRTSTGGINFLGDSGAGTIIDFVQNFDIGAAGGLSGLQATGVFEAAPGVDLAYGGSITLASNWNLGAASLDILGASADRGEALVDIWQSPSLNRYFIQNGAEGELLRDYATFLYRVGGDVLGAAPSISVLAGGDLDIRGSITDGLFNFRNQSDTAFRQVSLGGAPQTGSPRLVDAAFATRRETVTINSQPVEQVVVEFGSSAATQVNPLAPYSMDANSAAATGNDPLESAEVFPLVDGAAPGSASIRLTAGALGSNDPASTRTTSAADLRIGFDSQYSYSRGGVVSTQFSDNIAFVLATNPSLNGQESVVSASDWLQGVLATFEGVSTGTRTSLTFGPQNPALSNLRQAATSFFTADELVISGGVLQSVTTTVGRASDFLRAAADGFGTSLAAAGSGFTAQNLTTISNAQQTVAVRGQVRTGTGTISLAASDDIDLRTLDANGDAVRRVRTTQASSPNGSLVGSTPVYSAGARINAQATTAQDVLTGVARTVALVAGQTESFATIFERARPYGATGFSLPGIPVNVTPSLQSVDSLLALEGGGDVSIVAGGSLLAQRDDFGRQIDGSATTPWQVINLGANNNSAPVRIRISAANVAEAIGTLGGGTVRVKLDGVLSDATLVSAGSVSQLDVTGGGAELAPTLGLQFGGGGDIAVSAFGDIQRGLFDVGGSEATITTYGDILGIDSLRTAISGGQQANINFGASVRSATASVDISATGSARFAGLGNNSFLYTEASGVSILANGSIDIVPEGDVLNTVIAGSLIRTTLPGSIDVTSLAGQLSFYDGASLLLGNLDRVAFLYPSREGRLRLLAEGTLSASAIAMSDADIGGFNGPLSGLGSLGIQTPSLVTPEDFPPFALGASRSELTRFHNAIPTHSNNPEPVRIASGGDLLNLSLNLPKQARVSAARDIVNIIYVGQNINRNDTTRIVAGRDLTATVELRNANQGTDAVSLNRTQPTVLGNSIVLGGPGSLIVEAGRDAGPFLNSAVATQLTRPLGNQSETVTIPGGLLTVGNEQNPFLSEEGASLTLSFGVANGADFTGLRDAYVNADTSFLAELDDDFFGQVEDQFGNRFADREQPIYAPILFRWLQENQPELLQQTFGRTDIIPAEAFLGTYRNPDGSTEMRTSPAPGQTTVQAAFQSAADAYQVARERPDVFADAYRLYAQGVALLRTLPGLTQRQFLQSDVYFNELVQASQPESPSFGQSSRGYAAVETLFNPDQGYSDYELQQTAAGQQIVPVRRVSTGNLDLRLATLQTARGGDVTILAPGGNIIAGSVVRTSEQAARRNSVGDGLYSGRRIDLDGLSVTLSPATNSARIVDDIPLGFEGILTLRGGAIRSFTDGSLILNQSRLFTQQGGDIVLWSSGGDLNAGQGPRSAASFPPVQVLVDENAFSEVNVAGAISGAGIAGFQPSPDVQPPNVFLIAPLGTVDAGEAGIRVAGNLFISAQAVANAESISVGGTAVGVPAAAAVDAGANAAASAASTAASAATSDQANRAGGRGTAQSRITVEVIGYSGNEEEDPCKRRGPDRPATCPPLS